MRKARLLYNPLSGRCRRRRREDVEAILAVLRAAHVEADAAATVSGLETREQAREAIAKGCDTIMACGGDGTVHDTLQGMVGSPSALGIIPLGTANALAHDLQIPFDPVQAARSAIAAKPLKITLGRVQFTNFERQSDQRYFVVAAGIGTDAHLFYKLNPLHKHRLGMGAYYAKATWLWMTHSMRPFRVRYAESGSVEQKVAEVSELLAVRIRHFGGVLKELAPGASLQRKDLRLVLFRTRSRLSYLLYIQRGLIGTRWRVPGIDLVHSSGMQCEYLLPETDDSGNRIYVEADGELLGTLPAKITVVPDALTLLAP